MSNSLGRCASACGAPGTEQGATFLPRPARGAVGCGEAPMPAGAQSPRTGLVSAGMGANFARRAPRRPPAAADGPESHRRADATSGGLLEALARSGGLVAVCAIGLQTCMKGSQHGEDRTFVWPNRAHRAQADFHHRAVAGPLLQVHGHHQPRHARALGERQAQDPALEVSPACGHARTPIPLALSEQGDADRGTTVRACDPPALGSSRTAHRSDLGPCALRPCVTTAEGKDPSTEALEHAKPNTLGSKRQVQLPAPTAPKRATAKDAPATPRPEHTQASTRDVDTGVISVQTSTRALDVDNQLPEPKANAPASAATLRYPVVHSPWLSLRPGSEVPTAALPDVSAARACVHRRVSTGIGGRAQSRALAARGIHPSLRKNMDRAAEQEGMGAHA